MPTDSIFGRNRPFAKPGPYITSLSPEEHQKFLSWVKSNNVPYNPETTADYDMPGYWKDVASKGKSETAINPIDKRLHYPDTYKTPYHHSFSAESRYATETNPFHWRGEQLIDTRTGQTMPTSPSSPKDFDDAIGRLLEANKGMTRADAIQMIDQGVQANDPKFTKIPNVHDSLFSEKIQGGALDALRTFANTATTIPRLGIKGALGLAGPKALGAVEKAAPEVIEGIPPSTEHPSSAIGQALGGVAGLMAPGIGPEALVGKLPLLGKLPKIIRGAATGGILGATGAFGDEPTHLPFTNTDASPTALGAMFGAGGETIGKAWDAIGSRMAGSAAKDASVLAAEDAPEAAAKAGSVADSEPKKVVPEWVFGGTTPVKAPSAPPETIIEPEPSGARAAAQQFARQARAPVTDLFGGVRAPEGSTVPQTPLPKLKAERNAWFAVPPASPKTGFMKTAEERLRETTNEPIGTVQMREGQPFDIEAHNRLDGQRKGISVYAYPSSTLGRAGAPARASLTKPMIVDVPSTGTQSFIDAARLLHADKPQALKALNDAKDQIGLSQELIARYAKDKGFDSVSISTPDIKENVILGIGGHFKPSAHPDELPPTQVVKQPPAKTVFAPKEEPLPERMGGAAFSTETLAKLMADAKKAEAALPPHPIPEEAEFAQKAAAPVFDDVDRLGPEWAAASRQTHEASLAGLSRWRPVAHAINHPMWDETMMRVLQTRSKGDELMRTLSDSFSKLRETISENEFDHVHRAWAGLRYDANGKLVQSAIDVDPKHDAAARMLEQKVAGKAYEYLTGNDPRVPSLMERHNLDHTREQFDRLRLLQSLGPARDAMYASKHPPSHEEEIVAAASKGWLNYGSSHDLNIKPGRGFLSFYAVDNERAKVQDAINFLEAHKATGYGATNAQDTLTKLNKYKARLDYIDNQVKQEELRKYPSQDTAPKFKHFAPLKASTDPAARPLFPDTNLEKLLSKYISGVVDKRQSDVVLNETLGLKKHPDFQRADLQNYLTDYANTVRGSRGFTGDRKWADGINRVFNTKFTARDIHQSTSFVMNGMAWTRLFMSPVRFPIINLTHLFVGLYPVVGEKTFARAVGDVLANPTRWFGEAAEAGAIRKESDWIRELSEPETAAVANKYSRAFQTLTYVTENFRRAVAYRAGLLTEPENWSPVVKAFSKDAAAKMSPLEASKAYARGLTLTTQFETSMINKPLGFTGSPWKRLATQFRTWPVNLASLYLDMYKKGETKSLMRGLTSLWMLGGVSAVAGGPEIYNSIRDHFLRHTGVVLPNETGMETIANALGAQGTPIEWVTGMNLYSLHDPFALIPPSLSGFAGPTVGSTIDTTQQLYQAINDEDAGKAIRVTLGAVSPQARAMVEAGIEYFNNGRIFGSTGHLELQRPIMASLMRGLDLTPSARSIRYQTMQDLASARESGSEAAFEQLRQKAERDGVILDSKFWLGVKQIVSKRKKKHVTGATIWSQL